MGWPRGNHWQDNLTHEQRESVKRIRKECGYHGHHNSVIPQVETFWWVRVQGLACNDLQLIYRPTDEVEHIWNIDRDGSVVRVQ